MGSRLLLSTLLLAGCLWAPSGADAQRVAAQRVEFEFQGCDAAPSSPQVADQHSRLNENNTNGGGSLGDPTEIAPGDGTTGVEPPAAAEDLHIDVGTIRRIANLELANQEGLRIQIRCEGTSIALFVVGPQGRVLSDRRLDLSSSPAQGRNRLVALAAAELVAAGYEELTEPEPEPEPEPESEPEPEPEPVAPPPSLRLDLSLSARVFTDTPVWGLGGIDLQVLQRLYGPLWLAMGASFEAGWREVELGRIEIGALGGRVAARLSLPLGLGAGIGVRAQAMQMSGQSDQPGVLTGSVMGLSGGPFVELLWDIPLHQRWVLSLRAEGGLAPWNVVGEVEASAPLNAGLGWIQLGLGVGWWP